MKIEAHRSERPDVAELVSSAWEGIEEDFVDLQNPRIVIISVFSSMADDAKRAATCLHALGAERASIVRALRIRAEVEVARFQLAAHPGENVDVSIDGKVFSLRLDEVHGDTGPSAWIEGVSSAIATDYKSALATLAELGTEERLRRGRLVTGAINGRVEQALALRALATNDAPGARAWIARAREDLAREEKSITRQPAVRSLSLPEMALTDACAAGEPAAFNDALAKALEGHRAFWTRASERRLQPRDDPSGWLALEPLGIACLARQRGIPVDVESDYIPAWLVRRDW